MDPARIAQMDTLRFAVGAMILLVGTACDGRGDAPENVAGNHSSSGGGQGARSGEGSAGPAGGGGSRSVDGREEAGRNAGGNLADGSGDPETGGSAGTASVAGSSSSVGGSTAGSVGMAGAGGGWGGLPSCDGMPGPVSDSCAVYANLCSFAVTCREPPHQYVCKGGGSPPIPGCHALTSADGMPYSCCPELRCVRNAAQDPYCEANFDRATMYVCSGADVTGLPSGCTTVTNSVYCCP